MQTQTPTAVEGFRFLGPSAAFLLAMLMLAGARVNSGDWPQYRGPQHNGTSTERIRVNWSAQGPRQLWKKPLPDGFSSFAVSQGRAYTGVKRQVAGNAMEVYLALDANTGAELWARPVGPSPPGRGAGNGDGPRSTPSVDGEFVYVLSAYVSLFCLRASDGGIVWERDLLEEFGGEIPDFEAAASPLIVGDLVLVNGPAGGKGQRFFGLSKSDGRTVWELASPKLTHSTPVLATLHGVRQAIFFTAGGAVAMIPESGQELWRYSYNVSVPTAIAPVIGEDTLYHSAGYSIGARAARITKAGTTFRATEIWRKRDELINFWSTPVYHQGHVYGLYGHDYGLSAPLKCIELATGTEKWSEPNFGPGQVLLVDGKILLLTADGKLILAAPTPERYQELARFKALSGTCWNAPAISQGRIYARSNREGVCLDVSAAPPSPLRLLAPARQPDGGLQFHLQSHDGSLPAPERLGQLEVWRSTSLVDWTAVSNAVVSPDATIRVPPAEVDNAVPWRQFYRVREPQ
ncbi:MAG: PQQ-like beta-propeller repeat protein [Verrucomicrobiales bacterium]|nr:PQQ-like beta-propeller repeat protein [Verrucomicrobiales bacterium]